MTHRYRHRTFNPLLAARLAIKSLYHHRMVASATIVGVAIGMCVVSSILIVDFNTAHQRIRHEPINHEIAVQSDPNKDGATARTRDGPVRVITLPITTIAIVTKQSLEAEAIPEPAPLLPTQKGQLRNEVGHENLPRARGEEDYQTMRLAIRLASLLAFFIGAVIVFYTMRFSVASRSREFCLLLCLGEFRFNVSLSLLVESALLGISGTLIGLLFSLPVARLLLAMGISTTGRMPLAGFELPGWELGVMIAVSISIALVGVIGPIHSLQKMEVAKVLQPRFITDEANFGNIGVSGFSWLLPPLAIASYLAVRPFLLSWFSVVYFFVFEAAFVIGLTLATLWWTPPLLRVIIRLFESALRTLLPLETLLAGRRMRLTSKKLVFSIFGITLVFGLLTGLHLITLAIKQEINRWAAEAIAPYFFYERNRANPIDSDQLARLTLERDIYFFRLSAKAKGIMPMRLIHSNDINAYRTARGLAPFGPGQVIFSKTLAARFGVGTGDYLRLGTRNEQYLFEVLDVSDDVGAFAEDSQYVDLKSYALFSEGNAIFHGNLELTLGDYGMAKSAADPPGFLAKGLSDALQPMYQFKRAGRNLMSWQLNEIDKDFFIFDFILLMSIVLACIGVTNTLLIQVQAREREFSVLKSLGLARLQTIRLLLVEGAIMGLVSALLAVLLGNALGAISISFLDRFTLFHYEYLWSTQVTILIILLVVTACSIAALYPAFAANRISSAESLHYE